MYRNVMLITMIALLSISFLPLHTEAHLLDEFQSDEVKVTLIYSHQHGERSTNVKKLDLLLHHFTKHVRIVSVDEVTEEDIQFATHLVYYGEHERSLNKNLVQMVDQFPGMVLAIGENMGQFSSFSDIKADGKTMINAILAKDGEEQFSLNYPQSINRIVTTDKLTVLMYGMKGNVPIPLFVESDNRFYFGAVNLAEEQLEYALGDLLHEVLPNLHRDEHLAYIRLEDIHPMSDPHQLLAVGESLYERDIPFILVVFPVYINPETGEEVHFSNSPELVAVLQHLQERGGTIVSHGYTHQYRRSESGEGFEFWDVENEQFIIEHDPNRHIEKIKNRDQFPSKDAYDHYIDPLKENERAYIEERLEYSVHELIKHDLYPVAIVVPHYTMSQQGYAITSHYFSMILGQVQYSDERWEIMGAPPYVTSATFLNGMLLLPETIGYFDPQADHRFSENVKLLKRIRLVRDSVIGGFYHPYLGADHLDEFLAFFDNVPNLKWIDLKQEKHWVKTSKASIMTDGKGQIHVNEELNWREDLPWEGSNSFFEKVLWIVTAVVLLFICLFIIFLIYLRSQLKKQLFMERKTRG